MIVPLHAANPGAMTGSGNWTYLLTGRHPLLIDAGVGAASHLEALDRAHPGGAMQVVVTHAHSDHISGVAAIRSRVPEATFAKWPWPERDAKYDVAWRAVSDGDIIPAGDDELRVVHTPGHALDHIALWHEPTRTLFTGDLVVRGTTVMIPATSGGSLKAYLQSLERILELGPARLLPAHGPPIDEPSAIVREYIAHRREREVQIQQGLARGLRTVNALVEDIYVGLPATLVPMARDTVLAHLLKLEEDGLVRRESDDWAIIG